MTYDFGIFLDSKLQFWIFLLQKLKFTIQNFFLKSQQTAWLFSKETNELAINGLSGAERRVVNAERRAEVAPAGEDFNSDFCWENNRLFDMLFGEKTGKL